MLGMHPAFPHPRGFVVDALHTLFLGVTLHMLRYWFNKKHSKKPCSISQKGTSMVVMIIHESINFYYVAGLACRE